MTCNSLLKNNIFASSSRIREHEAAERRPINLGLTDICDWLVSPHSTPGASDCLEFPALLPGQEIAWCLKKRAEQRVADEASALFALGPHVAYGSAFDAAFALANETRPPPPIEDDGELRISMHIRHFDDTHTGRESVPIFLAELRKTVAAAGSKRCAVLLATDRRLTLQLMANAVGQVGCRMVQSARGAPVTDLWAEHGQDAGSVVLDDVFLLANGHVLIGTWGSTLTICIQQLMAARSVSRLPKPGALNNVKPTVTYCDLSRSQCLRPLPLVTTESNHWWVSFTSSAGAMQISTSKEMRDVAIGSAVDHTDADEWSPYPELVRGEYPPSDKAVKSLRELRLPAATKPRPNAWLAAIISRNASSERYRRAASAVASCGFEPMHIPAAAPTEYEELEGMMEDLFGVPGRRAARMSPHELGLVISHKRALKAIAYGPHVWGAVFEDDAYLHQAVSPAHAAHLLDRTFATAVDETPIVYLGACSPQCVSSQTIRAAELDVELLVRGRCRGYCTHAYALSRSHAASFFDEVFECRNASERCGEECETRPCYMDWALRRHFSRRGHAAWLLGGGFRSRERPEHRGLFVRNTSLPAGGGSAGTTVGKRYRWGSRSHTEAVKARWRCRALLDGGGVNRRPSGGKTAGRPLRKVFVTTRWRGRVGNLLFGTAGLIGVASRLNTTAPTEAFGIDLPSGGEVPAANLFERFPLLAKHVRRHDTSGKAGQIEGWFSKQYRILYANHPDHRAVRQCLPCRWTMNERSGFDEAGLKQVEEWVNNPPDGCVIGLVDVVGSLQSFKYFERISESVIHPALASMASSTEANEYLAKAKVKSGTRVIGVDVRLDEPLAKWLYAPVSWKYYRVAMRQLARRLDSGRTRVPIAFIVVAADEAEARKQLSSTVSKSRAVFFTADDPHTELAVLRACDGLVIGASSLGWWAAYLSKLPSESIIAPRLRPSSSLPERYFSRRGFGLGDYYPERWRLLDSSGNGTTQSMLDQEQISTALLQRKLLAKRTGGFQLERWSSRLWDNKVLQEAFAKARQARAKAMAKAKGRGGAIRSTKGHGK